MKKRKKKAQTNESAIVATMIFEQVYPLWKQYNGKVPESEMNKLDSEGDFPWGITARAVARLNREKSLQKRCESLFS